MSVYALVHLPKIDTTQIDAIRDEYDPYRALIGTHITIVFPVQVDRELLVGHIEETLAAWRPFTNRLASLVSSFDGWLFLNVQEGNEQLVKLFEELYTGMLASHRRHDIEYVPHIGLGYFGKPEYDPNDPRGVPLDEVRYREGLRRAEAANIDCETLVDRLSLIELDDQFTQTVLVREFML